MSLFSIDNDVKAFLLRAHASLDRADTVTTEATLLLREIREIIHAFRSVLASGKKEA